MTRDELEAAIWRVWPKVPRQAAAIDRILQAADAYAAARTPGIKVEPARARREPARVNAAPIPHDKRMIHYAPVSGITVCGTAGHPTIQVTADRVWVTCESCRRTRAFRVRPAGAIGDDDG